jgi:hypothetical protein
VCASRSPGAEAAGLTKSNSRKAPSEGLVILFSLPCLSGFATQEATGPQGEQGLTAKTKGKGEKNSRERPHDKAAAEVAVPVAWKIAGAKRRPAVIGAVAPTTATKHPERAALRPRRVRRIPSAYAPHQSAHHSQTFPCMS